MGNIHVVSSATSDSYMCLQLKQKFLFFESNAESQFIRQKPIGTVG